MYSLVMNRETGNMPVAFEAPGFDGILEEGLGAACSQQPGVVLEQSRAPPPNMYMCIYIFFFNKIAVYW